MTPSAPSLKIMVSNWSLEDQENADGTRWSLRQRAEAVAGAGFEAFSADPTAPGIQEALDGTGLRFGAGFDAATPEDFARKILLALAIDDGPINCQLLDHDTPVDEAVGMTIQLMEEAERHGAAVHLEAHRDTCTETPEKLSAIAEGVKAATGHYPRLNFDFSHPAIVKHLSGANYVERLFGNVSAFQESTLWHMRPFNGHHCQVPVTDGCGRFSPEYTEMRPFIRAAFRHWLAGPRPGHGLWVVPELGPKSSGYGLSCFPNIWEDTIVLGNDLRALWHEVLAGQGG